MGRANIVEIIWHDLGDWLSCYGWDLVPSPFLQSMAEQGALFEQHFCTAPQCSPSRASIMTGRYPHSNGMMGLAHRGWAYNSGEKDLAKLLAKSGYHTYLFGQQHEYNCNDTNWKQNTGYQCADTEEMFANKVAPGACRFFAQEAADRQPFFVSIGFADVHRNFGTDCDAGLLDRITVPPYLPDTDAVRKDIAAFCENIRVADEATGLILAAISEAGLDEDTIVVFTTDHGPEFPRAKMTVYDPGIKTALIMKCPGRIEAGTRIRNMTSNVDVLQTLLEAIGMPAPENAQGRSFWPLLTECPCAPRQEVFAELTWHTLYDPMRAVRTERYKYIWNIDPGRPILIGGPYAQRYGLEFIEQHYGQPRPEEELYDLENDPAEMTNLAEDDDYRLVKKELAARLREFLHRTDDPVLAGPVPHPGQPGYECYWTKEGERFKLHLDADFNEHPF